MVQVLLWVFGIFFITGLISYSFSSTRESHAEDSFETFGIISSVISGILIFVLLMGWAIRYQDHFDEQARAEAIIYSDITTKYQEFLQIEGDARILYFIDKLNLEFKMPSSEQLAQWRKDIVWYNTMIFEHNKANAGKLYDWYYPDWDAPKPIKIQ